MMKYVLCILGLLGASSLQADSGPNYLQKFMTYLEWSQHLPIQPNDAFLNFVSQSSPLSQKLRDRWLYELARTKNWKMFTTYYQPTDDKSLQCYAVTALLEQNEKQKALETFPKLWESLSGDPKPCRDLFARLIQDKVIDESLLFKRLVLALSSEKLTQAVLILKQFPKPMRDEISLLLSIHKKPSTITQLSASKLHQEFYLYGLKRMIVTKMDRAIELFDTLRTKLLLDDDQKQRFLVHLALYKAMRNQPDAQLWFSKIKPAYHQKNLMEWQIRYALTHQQWPRVEALIRASQDSEEPCWLYWLARALEHQGKNQEATFLYQRLATMRNYYGFLASRKLNQQLHFENESKQNASSLSSYYPLINQIKTLYHSKQNREASQLLSDFSSELPKDEKVALAEWIARELQWFSKAISFTSTDELNNQLSLRFPLAYRPFVLNIAKKYQVPEALIYAIIRQESAFRDDVTSSAGAKGLMQLMPATARVVSKQNKIKYANHQQLFSAPNNIEIGTAYLKMLSKRYHDHPLLVAAAYNAGPKQVAHWLKNHPPEDIDIWIETLPWPETRNYLKNIIAFYAVYQYRLKEKPNLSPFMSTLTSWGQT